VCRHVRGSYQSAVKRKSRGRAGCTEKIDSWRRTYVETNSPMLSLLANERTLLVFAKIKMAQRWERMNLKELFGYIQTLDRGRFKRSIQQLTELPCVYDETEPRSDKQCRQTDRQTIGRTDGWTEKLLQTLVVRRIRYKAASKQLHNVDVCRVCVRTSGKAYTVPSPI
jgi:hypothetical protein